MSKLDSKLDNLESILAERAGLHTKENISDLNHEQLAVFGAMEALDWECVKYGDLQGITEKELRDYLLSKIDVVNNLPRPPSFLGLLTGVFDFLRESK